VTQNVITKTFEQKGYLTEIGTVGFTESRVKVLKISDHIWWQNCFFDYSSQP